MIRLILTVEDETGRRYAFAAKESPVLIGSSVLADLRLEHRQLASLHARVSFDEMNATLEDLDSPTGCTKNGRRLVPSRPEGILDDAPVVLGGIFRLASSWGEVDDTQPEGNPFVSSRGGERDDDTSGMSAAALAARTERLRGFGGGGSGAAGAGSKGRIAYGRSEPAASKLSTGGKTLFMTGPAAPEAGSKTLLHMPAATPASAGPRAGAAASAPSWAAAPVSSSGSSSGPLGGSSSGSSGGSMHLHGAPFAPGLTPAVSGGMASGLPASVAAPPPIAPARSARSETPGGRGTPAMPTGISPPPSATGRETPSWSSAASAGSSPQAPSPQAPSTQAPSMPSGPRDRGTPAFVAKASSSSAVGGASEVKVTAVASETSPAPRAARTLGGSVPRLPDTVLAMPSASDLAASLPQAPVPAPALAPGPPAGLGLALPRAHERGEARTLLDVSSPFAVGVKGATAQAPAPAATQAAQSPLAAETSVPAAGSGSSVESEPARGGPRATRVGRVAWATDAIGVRSAKVDESLAAAPARAAEPSGQGDRRWPFDDVREPAPWSGPERTGQTPAPERTPAERGPADLSALKDKVQPLARRPVQGQRRSGRAARKQAWLLAGVFVVTLVVVLGVGAWLVLKPSEELLPPDGPTPRGEQAEREAPVSASPGPSSVPTIALPPAPPVPAAPAPAGPATAPRTRP